MTVENKPRSQKAKGIIALAGNGVSNHLRTPAFQLIQRPTDKIHMKLPCFARPCPTVPRHGFVESRVVQTEGQIVELLAEAMKADPGAEVLLMPFIEAESSAILVAESGVLALGPKHDGATGGHNSIALPVLPLNLENIYGFSRSKAGIKSSDHCYFELVYANPRTHPNLVQARGGPPLEGLSTEYVPKKTVVWKVLKPTDDLLEWEELVVKYKGQQGVVGWSPRATLASHAAVHCVAAGIPFLTRDVEPKVGDVIKPSIAKMPRFNRKQFWYGVRLAEQTNPIGAGNRVSYSILAVLHNATRLKGSAHWSRLLGFAAGMTVKCSALACHGELRHYGHGSKTTREDKYEEFEWMSISTPVIRLGKKMDMFLHNGKFSGAFGGIPWFRAAVGTIKLYKAMTKGDEEEVLTNLNSLINTFHNTGRLLNKFISGDMFDDAAKRPAVAAMIAGDVLFNAMTRTLDKSRLRPKRYDPQVQGFNVQVSSASTEYVNVVVNGIKLRALPLDHKMKMLIKDYLEEC